VLPEPSCFRHVGLHSRPPPWLVGGSPRLGGCRIPCEPPAADFPFVSEIAESIQCTNAWNWPEQTCESFEIPAPICGTENEIPWLKVRSSRRLREFNILFGRHQCAFRPTSEQTRRNRTTWERARPAPPPPPPPPPGWNSARIATSSVHQSPPANVSYFPGTTPPPRRRKGLFKILQADGGHFPDSVQKTAICVSEFACLKARKPSIPPQVQAGATQPAT